MGKNQRIILILGLAIAFRLINLDQSFWLDEGAQMLMAEKSLAFQWFGRAADFHPPLYALLMHFWIRIGRLEWFLRLPSLIFGVGTVYLIYLFGKKAFNEKIGLISALFLAIAPYHVFYSQEARMYSLLAFLGTASMLFLVERKWLVYILATTALLYTHYAGFFLIAAQVVWIVFWQKKILRIFLKNLFFSFLLFIPWLPQFIKQLRAGSNLVSLLPGWRSVANLPFIKAAPLTFIKFSLGRVSLQNQLIYFVVGIGIFTIFGFFFFQAIKRITREKIFLLNWLLLPIVLTLLISIIIPMYQPFRILFTIVPFYLLLAVGVFAVKKKWQPLAMAGVLLISSSGLGMYYSNPNLQRENWREATTFIESQEPEGSLAIFKFSEPFAPYQWYSWGRVIAVGVLPGLRATPEIVEARMTETTEKKNEVFLFEYLGGLTDPDDLVDHWLLENGFTKKETNDFSGVGFVYYYQRQ